MSAEIRAKTRALQAAGHPATSSNQEALSVMVLTRRIRLWLHVCTNHCFHYVCTAAGLVSPEIQAKTRALQRAELFTTLSHQEASLADGVDPSDKTLAARVHLRLVPFRLNGCGAHVCRNPDRNTRSTGGWAPSHVIKPGGTLSDGVDSSDKTLAARVHQPLLPPRLYGCGTHVCKNPGRYTRSTASWARHNFITPGGLLGWWC